MTRSHLQICAALVWVLLLGSTAFAFQVRAVIAADTHDRGIGQAVEIDALAMRSHLERITEAAGINLDLTYLVGDDCTAQAIEEAVEGLHANPNDVVFFYYTGHGINDNGERWPLFTLGGGSVSFIRVRELIAEKNARLSVIFSDCCNCPQARNVPPQEGKVEFEDDEWSPDPNLVRQLLAGHAGEIRVTSSQFPEFSWIAPQQEVQESPWLGGSVWTRPLLRAMREQLSPGGEANWRGWLEDTHDEALVYAQQSYGQDQTSVIAIEIDPVELDEIERPDDDAAVLGDEMPLLFEEGGPWRQHFTVEVTDEHQVLILALVSFGGDLDLYVRHGAPMESPKDADFKSNNVGDVDSLFLSRKSGERPLHTGRYYLMIDNVLHAPATGTLYVQRLGHGPALSDMMGSLRPNRPVTVNVPEDTNRIVQYTLDVPAAAESVRLTLREADTDIDLYVREEAPIVRLQDATWSSRSKDGDETLVLDGQSDPPLTPGSRLFVAVHNPSGVATRARLNALVRIEMTHPGEYASRLDESSRRYHDHYAQYYNLQFEFGQEVRVRMNTDDFEPTLVLVAPDGTFYPGERREEGRESYLHFFTRTAGVYSIIATTAEPQASGNYRIQIMLGSEARRVEPGTYEGYLAHTDESYERRARRYADYYLFEAEQGQTIRTTMRSSEVDSFIFLESPEGHVWWDDDGGGGLDSLLEVEAPVSGTYRLVATSYGAREVGAYTVNIEVLGEGAEPTPEPQPAEGVLEGEITAESPVYERSSTPAVHVPLVLEQGQVVSIEAYSEQFSPALYLEFPDGDYASDEAGETTATLGGRALETGRYDLYITTRDARRLGRFRLTVMVDGEPYRFDDPPTLELEPGVRRGELSAESPIYERRNTHHTRYTLHLEAGEHLHVDLESDEFDAFLILEIPDGEVFENDDGGEGTNARISGRIGLAGEYGLIATTHAPGETGRYRLRVLVDEQPYDWDREAQPTPADEPGVRTDELTEASAIYEGRGTYYHRYPITFSEGRIRIVVESDDFNRYVLLETADGTVLAEGTGALQGNIQGAPEFAVVVTTRERGETGAYRLTITLDGEPFEWGGEREPDPVRMDTLSYDGELTEDSWVYEPRGTRADSFTLELPQGMDVRVDMMSEDFDPYLYVYLADGTRLFDDDSGEGHNSRIRFTTAEAGEYRIIATTFSPETTGAYSLRVYRGTEPEPEPIPAITGELTERSGRTERGFGDAYFVDLAAGQRVQIDMISEDFDSFLIVRRPDGVTASDRRGGDGNNARLRFRAPIEGTYEILATTFRDGATGRYELIVEVEGAAAELDGPHRPIPPAIPVGLNTETAVICEGREMVQYVLELERRAHNVRIALENSTVDFDLYVRFGEPMETRAEADDASVTFHWDEQLEYPMLEPGRVYIGAYNDTGSTGRTTLVVEGVLEEDPDAEPQPEVTARPINLHRPIEVHAGPQRFAQVVVALPEDPGTVTISLEGSTADFDLYARMNAPMTSLDEAEYSAVSFAWDEELMIEGLGGGNLFVLAHNDSPNEGLTTLTVRATNVVAPPEPREPAPALDLEPNTPTDVRVAPQGFTQFAVPITVPHPQEVVVTLEGASTEHELVASTRPMGAIDEAEFAGSEELIIEWHTGYGERLFVALFNHDRRDELAATLSVVLVAPEPVEGVIDIEPNTYVPLTVDAQRAVQYRVRVPYADTVALVTLAEATADFDLYTRLDEPMHSRDDATDSSATFDWNEELRLFELDGRWLYILAFNDTDLPDDPGDGVASGEAVLHVRFPSEAGPEAPVAIATDQPQQIRAEPGRFLQYELELGEGEHQVYLELSGASVDFDLYARLGDPMRRRYDASAAAETASGDETLMLTTMAERLYIGVYNDSRLDGEVVLTASVTAVGPTDEAFRFVHPNESVPVAADAQEWVQLESYVPYGATTLRVELYDTDGDFDLYLRFGEPMENRRQADHRAVTISGDETIEVTTESSPPLVVGPLFILVFNDERERRVTGNMRVTVEGVVSPSDAESLAFEQPRTLEIGGGRNAIFALEVPEEAQQLRLQLIDPTASMGLHASRRPFSNPAMGLWHSAGAASNNMLVLSRDREPPLMTGMLYVLVHNETPYTGEAVLVAYYDTDHVDAYLEPGATAEFTLPNRGAPFVQYGIVVPEGVNSLGFNLEAPEGVEMFGYVRRHEPFREFSAEEVDWRLGRRLVIEDLAAGMRLYVMLASNESRQVSGRLYIEPGAYPAEHEPRPLQPGVNQGELTTDDESIDGRYVHRYVFEGNAGDEVTIRLESRAFDAYLVLIGPGSERWENDDAEGEDTTDAQLTLTLPSTGRYEVHVTTFREHATGPYRLRFQSGSEEEEEEDAADEGTDDEDAEDEDENNGSEDF